MRPIVLALIICVIAAALEGLIAGRGVRARFRELRLPSYSPPLAIWVLIGGAYYVICYVILYRLLAAGLPSSRHQVGFVMLLVLMVLNAAWGWLFFRRKDLRASYLAFFLYDAVAVFLIVVLAGIDAISALLLVPYLLYQLYAIWWAHRLWKLNSGSSASGLTSA
jgi:tryptophan-rich sensory protein